MGQYHYVVNFTKKEYLHPHVFGDGLKLMEIACSDMGTMLALAFLLAQSNGLGGGDFDHDEKQVVGSWAGDQISIVGDYDGSRLHDEIHKHEGNELILLAESTLEKPVVWKNVSKKVLDALLDQEFFLEHFTTPPAGHERMQSFVMARRKAIWAELRPDQPWRGQ